MDYRHSVEFLYALGNEHRTGKLGLERIRELLRELSNPQDAVHFVHVAGTNGKGSTCAMIESGLRAAGFRTGLYTSPHLQQPTERIQIGGRPVSEERFVSAFKRVREAAESVLGRQASYFETITAMALLLFREEEVEIVALEVGLGGRLDATNAVTPELSVITPVDYDHESWLGDTIEAIAGEKAGILKPSVPAVIAPQRPEADGVFCAAAARLGVPVFRSTAWSIDELEIGPSGSRFVATGERSFSVRCPLAGEHQVINAVTAVAALDRLGIATNAVEEGIARTVWPGRLERVSSDPEIWLDGAHNPAGAKALLRHIQTFFTDRRITMIFGAMRDKAVPAMAATLFPIADRLILTAPAQERSLDPHLIADVAGHPRFQIADGIEAALDMAAGDDLIFVTGSLYLVGEARSLLVK
jgi:dihydrofolate synthase/folylpolyglutamate synthase